VLKRFLALRLEIEMFMSEKGKVVAELSDENWFWDFALLCNISHHVNDLNNKLQGEQKLVSDMFGAVTAFEIKLELFCKQLENVYLCNFSSCDLLHKDGSSASVLIPYIRVVEMIDSLAENFKMRFNGFRCHENPFSVEVNDDPEKLQFQLGSFIYASIPVSRFPE
jgi:hypothetical protein